MSQLPLIAAAYQADLTRDALEMIEHNTREGRHLKKVMGILYQAGMPDDRYTLKIRHGLVIDEIRQESRDGNYDLIVVGAHEVPEEKSWNELRELFQDNITGRLLTLARRPVLVVKAGPNGIRWPS
jgi:nucleotide-binding universal stress UspA family protein